MSGLLHALLGSDHDRLDRLLANSLRGDGTIDDASWSEFRCGLLRHIGIEERVLFPELRRLGGSTDVEEQLHRDHAVLAALLVPPPAAAEIRQIRAILLEHNPLEEDAGGFYDRMEALAEGEIDALVERARAYPQVPTAPYTDTPFLRRTIDQLLRQAEEGRRLLGRPRQRS
ncbi:MAG TPA: hemerythrin domain-containing protein [Thermoanaerobaculia bacterium]